MGRRTILATLICAVLLTAVAGAEEMQIKMQYKDAASGARVPLVAGRYIMVLKDLPTAELPKLFDPEKLIYKWESPLAKDGGLLIAIDRSKGAEVRDTLYIDTDADGSLADEKPIRATSAKSQHASFGPVKLVLGAGQRAADYNMTLRLCDHHTHNLYITSAGWYEATVKIGDKEMQWSLTDRNANGTFNDRSIDPTQRDVIQITADKTTKMVPVGNYIDIDGTLYNLAIARGGATMKLSKATDIAYSKVKLSESVAELVAGGRNGVFTLKPKAGVAELPAGRYHIDSWTIEQKDGSDTWKIHAASSDPNAEFRVRPAATTDLDITGQIVATIDATGKDGTYAFNHTLKGKLGETISLAKNGKQPDAPKLRIRSKDGEYDKTFAFKYG